MGVCVKFPDAPKFPDEPVDRRRLVLSPAEQARLDKAVKTPGTVANLIERFIKDMAAPEMDRQLGGSEVYTLRYIQRMPIGGLMAEKLKKSDIIDFARELRKSGKRGPRKAASVGKFIGSLSVVLKHAGAAWKDCEEVSDVMILAAKPFLRKHKLIGKADRRTRRPTDEEITALLNYYTGRRRMKIPMPEIIAFALKSARRLGEIARITHGDVDYENKIYWVRDLKHPTKKNGNDKKFILFPELETIIRRQPRLTDNAEECIFKFNPKSASQSYTRAKKAVGIAGLVFHDNRGDCISRWLLTLEPQDVRLAVSGHETTQILETVYDRRDTLELVKGKLANLVKPQASA